MKRLIMVPEGWPCALAECRPGHFMVDNMLCFKSEYHTSSGKLEAFNGGGEYFWGGETEVEKRDKTIVQPVQPVWEEYEE